MGCTRGRSQDRAGEGQAGGWVRGGWNGGARGRSMQSVLRTARWGEDLLDEFGNLDARDDAQRTSTHATVFDVDVEDSLEPLHGAHGRGTREARRAMKSMGSSTT